MSGDQKKRPQTYVRSDARLRDLPKIFRGNDLILSGVSEKSVSVYLSRWKEEGLIESLGGRSDVFFNALRYADHPWVEDAILEIAPGALQMGVFPLKRYEWTTQEAQKIEVAIPGQSIYTSNHVYFAHRPIRWFKAVNEGIERPQQTLIRSLTPSWALADMWLAKENWAWKPDPDDLDFFAMEPYLDEFTHAFSVLSKIYRKDISMSTSRDFYSVYMKMRDQILEQKGNEILKAIHAEGPSLG